MKKRVAIIGGGVSGLCAAHELLEKGFAVDIYERNDLPGGKARSFDVPPTEHMPSKGRRNLPAEHGFRFFPGFYRHLDETLSKIRYATNTSVLDILTSVDQMNYGRFGRDIVSMPAGSPTTLRGALKLIRKWISCRSIGMPMRELLRYWWRLARFFSSCDERVHHQYEEMSWWQFLDAEHRSLHYRRFFASSSRILVAADPLKASAKTNGIITEQFVFDLRSGKADRVLPGPTNQTWLFPWLHQMHGHPDLRFFFNAEVTEVCVDKGAGKVSGLVVKSRDPTQAPFSELAGVDRLTGPVLQPAIPPGQPVTADYYICATPVEAAARFMGTAPNWTDLAQADPTLRNLVELQRDTQWMSGIMFYLTGNIQAMQDGTLRGHSVYIDTPFALTSIFQEQHWDPVDFPMSSYGQGNLAGICSVCVSNWNDTEPDDRRLPNRGLGRKSGLSASQTVATAPDFEAGKQALVDDIWADLKYSLSVGGKAVLNDSNLLHWYLDPAIQMVNGRLENSEPLLVNRKGRWKLRPETTTALDNFFLAGDYVRTHTDLATMEAACESGLRAFNAIADREKLPASDKRVIHPLRRLPAFAPMRFIDKILYRLKP